MRALTVLLFMTAVTGIAYPLFITGISALFMPHNAAGSMIYHKGKPVGSLLIGQKFSDRKYFWGRPSAVNYNPLPSGGSQLSSTSLELKNLVKEREVRFTEGEGEKVAMEIPSELLYASGSGLDPHISVRGAFIQIDRILKERKLGDEMRDEIISLIDKLTEKRKFGFLGNPGVNVLELNLALDELQVSK